MVPRQEQPRRWPAVAAILIAAVALLLAYFVWADLTDLIPGIPNESLALILACGGAVVAFAVGAFALQTSD